VHVEVNGTRLWFDVEGQGLVPDGAGMCERPAVVVVHGGPGSYDHSYFKPSFTRLAATAQVVYLDLRDHGRSARHDPEAWNFEVCADDLRAFCDTIGLVRPIVLGHSMGGIVAMLYGARHAGHPGGLVLVSTMARFDLGRLVDGVRAAAGDDVADLARRDYGGDPVSESAWRRVFAAFGPVVPTDEQLARRLRNLDVGAVGMGLLRALDVVDELRRIACPTLVCVGALDPVTPCSAAQEIVDALPHGIGRLAVLEHAGHFPWLDVADDYWALVEQFVATVALTPAADTG
jgi:pimeloyl-ACP methyl ester carboxylesterase